MQIPAKYWQYVTETAATYNVDPVRLLETAAWQVVERGLDIIASSDDATVDVPLDPAITDMLDELGPTIALFSMCYLARAAKAMRDPQYAQPQLDGSRATDGRFKSLHPNSMVFGSAKPK